jgi:hypothetical protein
MGAAHSLVESSTAIPHRVRARMHPITGRCERGHTISRPLTQALTFWVQRFPTRQQRGLFRASTKE